MKRKSTADSSSATTNAISLSARRAARDAAVRRPVERDFKHLPFIKSLGRGKGFDYWSVETTGSYTEDCELGRQYAEQFLSLARINFHVTMLGPIVSNMIRKGPDDAKGIVIGFMATISKTAFSFRALMARAGVGT